MNAFAFSSLLIFLFSIGLVFFLCIKGKKDKITTLWIFVCSIASIWGLGGYKFSTTISKEVAFFWWQIAYISVIFTPVTFYHFVYTFLKLNKKYYKYILLLVYVLGVIFLIFNFFIPSLFLGDLRLIFNQFWFLDWLKKKNILYLLFYISFYCLLWVC